MKKIMLMALLLIGILTAADTSGYTVLVVQLKDGKYDVYQLDTKPVMTYEGSQMVLKTDLMEAQYERSAVRNINFGDEATGVVSAKKETFKFAFSGNEVRIEGLAPNGVVRVSDMGGRLVATARPTADGTVRVPLGGFGNGTYVINIDRQKTIKVIKR